MKSSEYWKKRFELLEQLQNRQGRECYADIERQYRRAQKELEGQIASWYQRFASNNGITMQDARKLLTGRDLAEFKWDVQDYIRYAKDNAISGIWTKQLENASARYHISRLEALKVQTQQSLEVLFGNQLDSIDSAMRGIYTEGYYRTAFEIQKGVGIGWDFATLDDKTISKVINKPWAADGKNFSERVWGNRQKLVNELNTELTRNMILGRDPQKAIDAIAKKMNTSKSNAGRLVMTEEAFFSSAAQKDCFTELDVEQFEIVATLDAITSEICRDMDGKHYPMSQWEVGITAQPFHPWCRTTTIPYFDDELASIGERAARGEDEKTYYVPANMTYQEWKEAFVDDGDKSGLQSVGRLKNQKSVPQTSIIGKAQGPSLNIGDALSGANPNYSTDRSYKVNCQRCVQAYELRRRGYDVEALPKPAKSNTIIWGNECFVDSLGNTPGFTFHQSEKDIRSTLASAPDGSRYIIYAAWKNSRSAHVFIAEKEKGVIRFVDPQQGKDDVEYYFSLAKNDRFGILRVDDKDLTQDMSIISATVR